MGSVIILWSSTTVTNDVMITCCGKLLPQQKEVDTIPLSIFHSIQAQACLQPHSTYLSMASLGIAHKSKIGQEFRPSSLAS
mmetsp:Transcript_9734/g.14775  ORF Transcript_9734/g.14775 Transcript_9734/m.14775 type:complete len:81 (+) Transcript_9734:13-255(+)